MEMNIPSSASSTHLDLQRVFKGASGVGSRCTGGRAAMQRTADPWTRVQIPARAPDYSLIEYPLCRNNLLHILLIFII